jgi:hypothetical protein
MNTIDGSKGLDALVDGTEKRCGAGANWFLTGAARWTRALNRQYPGETYFFGVI